MSPNAERNIQRKIVNVLPSGAIIIKTEKFSIDMISGTGKPKKTNRIRIHYEYKGERRSTVISGMPRGIPLLDRRFK